MDLSGDIMSGIGAVSPASKIAPSTMLSKDSSEASRALTKLRLNNSSKMLIED